MFCKKCGKEIPDGFSSCPYCDNSSIGDTAPINSDPFGMPPEPNKNGNGKKIAIIASISALVVAVIAIVLVLIFSDGNTSTRNNDSDDSDSKGYIRAVEDYLDFLAYKKDDPQKFVSDFYFGGEFGEIFCTDDTMSEHEIILEAMYEEEMDDMYYGYEEYDNWEDYISAMIRDEIYDELENRLGNDWKLKYDITDSEELSNSEVEDLQDDRWEKVIDTYADDFADHLSDYCTRSEVRKVEELAEEMNSWEIETAYNVEVEVKVTGEDTSDIENTFDFKVAQVNDEWVILDGPGFHELFRD